MDELTNFDINSFLLEIKSRFQSDLAGSASYDTFINPLKVKSIDPTTNKIYLLLPDEWLLSGWENNNKKYYQDFIKYSFEITGGKILEPILETSDSTVQNIQANTTQNNVSQIINNDSSNSQPTSRFIENNSDLNPYFTFDSWVVGPSNDVATAFAQSVADNPGSKGLNPLLISGGVGLGKTHLMIAIGNRIHKYHPEWIIRYVTTDEFMSDYVRATRAAGKDVEALDSFKSKYRDVDVLLVDDIQFLNDREGTQEEFFNTFNHLTEKGKQIILTSDKLPKEIPNLMPRLQTRFSSGGIQLIQKPEQTTRESILQKLAEERNVSISNDVIHFIATQMDTSVRELEGVFNNFIALAQAGREISIDSAKQELDKLKVDNQKLINLDSIKHEVADYFNININDLDSEDRSTEFTTPRFIAMYLGRTLLKTSFPKLAESFHKKDHTSAMNAVKKITKRIEEDSETKEIINVLTSRIKGEAF
jgi:chromosomal replication initiator protein